MVDKAPGGERWLHEIKHDGYRLQCRIEDGAVQLLTRTGLDWTKRFPVLAREAKQLPVRAAVLDGEVVVLRASGQSSFEALQDALSAGSSDRDMTYFLFDLLHLDGMDLTAAPLESRKAALRGLLETEGEQGRIHFSDHLVGNGPAFLAQACAMGLEGAISKRRDAPYRSGRSAAWVKSKCIQRQEFVIAGYKASTSGRPFRSLLLAVNEGGRLVYAGHVGTGWSEQAAAELYQQLQALRTTKPTLQKIPPEDRRKLLWVEPKLVCEVAFTERTSEGDLRHPSFQGLRTDKPPSEVVLEGPRDGSR